MSSHFASALNGAADGVRLGASIRDRRDAANARHSAAQWKSSAANWEKQARYYHGELLKSNNAYDSLLADYEKFIEEKWNPLVRNYDESLETIGAWKEHSEEWKWYMKKGYSLWAGAEYDKDSSFKMIEKLCEIIRELDPDNKHYDNPNKIGITIQNMAKDRIYNAIERYLKELEEEGDTPFTAQFTEELLREEVSKREERAEAHRHAVEQQDLQMRLF